MITKNPTRWLADETKKVRKHKHKRSEAREQRQLVAWLRNRDIHFWHTPNELVGWGGKGAKHGAQQRAMGVEKGVPDIVITTPVAGYRGVAVELKRPGESVTPDQEKWIKRLEEDGHAVLVAYSAQEAIEWLVTLGFPA
jgi:hypothetical protein